MRTKTTGTRERWGREIADARQGKGITQLDLAIRTGRNPQTISRLERGDGLALDTYLLVAADLGLTLTGGAE